MNFNRQRSEELTGRHTQVGAELEQAAAQAAECERRAAAQVETVNALTGDSAALTSKVESLAARAQSRVSNIAEAEQRIEGLNRVEREAGQSLLRLHGEQKQAEEALVHQGQALNKLETNEHDMLESSIRMRDEADQAAHEFEAASGQLSMLKQRTAELQTHIGELKLNSENIRQQADAIRDSLSGVRARHSTLTQILNDRSYTADAVQKLFAANERSESHDFHAVGVLADYAEVQEQHEAAIEQYLRDELEYVVVETYDHARAGVSLLRNEVGGRATFFVDSLRNLRLDEYEPIINFRVEDGVISRLDKLVEFRDPLGAAAKQFLPRLKAAYLADDAGAAERLARDNPQFAFVTPDGTTYQGRMVTGGRADEAGPLGMKRELRALDAEIMQLEHESSTRQFALEAVATELMGAEKSLEEVSSQQREADHDVFAARHRHQQMQGELARLGLELTVCQNELQRIRQEVERVRSRAEQAKNEHAAATAAQADAQAERARITEQLVDLRSSIESDQNELAAGRAELAALNERLAAASALATRLAEEHADLVRREAAFRQQIASVDDELAGLAQQSQDLSLQLEGLRGEKLRLEIRHRELEQEWDGGRNRVGQMEDQLRSGRQSLQEIREQRSTAEIARARNDSDRQHLRETCMAEVNAQPEDLIATETAFMSGEELATAEASYKEMKARIDAMGPVNMMALEEFNECDQRFTFMTPRARRLAAIHYRHQAGHCRTGCRHQGKIRARLSRDQQKFLRRVPHHFRRRHGRDALDRSGQLRRRGHRHRGLSLRASGCRIFCCSERRRESHDRAGAADRDLPLPAQPLLHSRRSRRAARRSQRRPLHALISDMSGQTQFIIVTHNRNHGDRQRALRRHHAGAGRFEAVSVRWEGDAPTKKERAAAASAA